jgi:hypothetical protein
MAQIPRKRKIPGSFEISEPVLPEDLILEVKPVNFMDRVEIKRSIIGEKAEQAHPPALGDDEYFNDQKEAMSKLAKIGHEVARAAKDAGVKPEMTIGKTSYNYDQKRFTQTKRGNKLVNTNHKVVHDGGWLLARAAGYIGKRKLVQEVMLGNDGGLYTYFREDAPSWDGAAVRPISRYEVQMSPRHQIAPPWGEVELATFGNDLNFYRLDGPDDYPLPGVGGKRLGRDVQIQPETIQKGLEELVLEKGL